MAGVAVGRGLGARRRRRRPACDALVTQPARSASGGSSRRPPPAAQATPLAALAPVDEPPRARVRRWQPAIPSPAPAPTPATVETAVAPPAQPSASGETPPRTPGQSGLRLESIAYATAAGERRVTLAIDGAPPVVLRQGESASGIEVQLILPDAVYVRNGTDVFALGAVR